MSVVAVVVGVVLGLTVSRRLALAGVVASFAATTLYLIEVADPRARDDLTAGFWAVQGVVLLLSLGACAVASSLRSRRSSSPV